MIEIRRILCPLDLSEISATVLGYASMLARWYDATLRIVEVEQIVVTPQQRDQFTAELERFVRTQDTNGVATETFLREGTPAREILREARALPADLIVLGTHGRGRFERLVLGSVTEKVLRLAPCPVLVIPAAATGAPTTAAPFKAIVCAIDFSPASLHALRYAASLAQESGKQLILVHVLDWPVGRPVPAGTGPDLNAFRRKSEERAREELSALVDAEARQWCQCEEIVALGRPYEEILRIAGLKHADLIVMGVHGRTAVDQMFFGSTATQLVRHAACPVLTIRP